MSVARFVRTGGPEVEAMRWEWGDGGMARTLEEVYLWMERVTGLVRDGGIWRYPPRPRDAKGPIAHPTNIVTVDPYTADLNITRHGRITVPVGWWIVGWPEGTFAAVPPDTFLQHYQPVSPLTVTVALPIDGQEVAQQVADALGRDDQ